MQNSSFLLQIASILMQIYGVRYLQDVPGDLAAGEQRSVFNHSRILILSSKSWFPVEKCWFYNYTGNVSIFAEPEGAATMSLRVNMLSREVSKNDEFCI